MIITKAKSLAYFYHEGQYRKYTGEPYINHCKNVAYLVNLVIYDENMIAAAWLHDSLEDTKITQEEIAEHTNDIVLSYVNWLTDENLPKGGNRAIRKNTYKEKLALAPKEVQTIKLADLIDNSSTICRYDPKFAKVYLKEKEELLKVLDRGYPSLLRLAESILRSNYYLIKTANISDMKEK